jgi:hypothetical protein
LSGNFRDLVKALEKGGITRDCDPEGGTEVPESETEVPEGGTEVPEGGTEVPESGTDVPEGGAEAPEEKITIERFMI